LNLKEEILKNVGNQIVPAIDHPVTVFLFYWSQWLLSTDWLPTIFKNIFFCV